MKVVIFKNAPSIGNRMEDFDRNPKFKRAGFSNRVPNMFEPNVDILKNSLGEEIIHERFTDKPLVKEQTQNLLEEYLNLLITLKKERITLETPQSLQDVVSNRDLIKYQTIIDICNECLKEDKPLYLTIE